MRLVLAAALFGIWQAGAAAQDFFAPLGTPFVDPVMPRGEAPETDFGPYPGPSPYSLNSSAYAGVLRASETERERDMPGADRAGGRIERLAQLFPRLRACWRPARDLAGIGPTGMEVTVRLAFKRNGEILGKPRVTYYKASGDAAAQERFRRSITEALARCSPLPFSDGFGGAFAGRPITIRFIDDRSI